MLIVKRGKWWIVPIVGILAAFKMNVITNALFDNEYYGSHLWPKFATFSLAGLLSCLAGVYLCSKPVPAKDKDWFRGEAADHLFFIPVTYWGLVYVLLGVIYVVYSNRH